MRLKEATKVVIGYVWRVSLCAFAYVAGTMALCGQRRETRRFEHKRRGA